MSDHSTKKLIQLEKNLEELNDLIEKMEHGGLSLEESLACFERGIRLVRNCQKTLIEAEQKIQLLTEKKGDFELSSFNADESDDE
jgi:exodeoxyribonuclease VII small subunit